MVDAQQNANEKNAMTSHKVSQYRKRVIAPSACHGKYAHESFEDARRAIRPHMGNRVQAYRCPVCLMWHVGSTDPKRARQKAAR